MTRVTLDDKYREFSRPVYLTGPQALVRLLILQKRRDRAAGRNTAGFVSGYRGSPLGGLDFALWAAHDDLAAHDIRFEPGLNEDLAATAVWGTQQIDLLGQPTHDGVFAMWYGKNPGLDRSGDALKHANMAGTAPLGGVLALSGDDPGAASSSIPNQCEQAFMAAGIPVLYPADVVDLLTLGLAGYGMSRHAGLWVGVKLVADMVESSASVDWREADHSLRLPTDLTLPPEGLGGRWPDDRWSQDRRLQDLKLPAAQAFARANGIDRVIIDSPRRRLGIVAAGKAYLDVMEALDLLGLSGDVAAQLGLTVYKPGMLWPLEPEGAARFARGLEEVLVVEERRSFVETQLKELAYHWPASERPRIVGKTDETGRPLLPPTGETSAELVARIVGGRLSRLSDDVRLREAMARLEACRRDPALSLNAAVPLRMPHFCAGCPHARSTRLPQGSLGLAGIGCHSMAMWDPESGTRLITQMGGEGANWIGAAPYVDRPHVFQNMGDGTYYHSGLLAIRAAVAAGTRITFKILYNDAVAMTGGQPVEGRPSPEGILWQLYGEGVGCLYLVASEQNKYRGAASRLPPGTQVRYRDALDEVMRACAAQTGVSAIVYDQICATEKRRHRKRGQWNKPEPRVFINEAVCEGCGDCSVKSRCVGVHSVETPFGVKRQIDQSVCNTDMSCVEGFCPSFVTVEGAELRRRDARRIGAAEMDDLTDPQPENGAASCDILIAGAGGTGLITIGAILGVAAHVEGRPVRVLDNTGLARKGGEVSTHVRLGSVTRGSGAARIRDGGATLILGGELLVTAGDGVLAKAAPGRTRVVVNDRALPTLAQARDAAVALPVDPLRQRIAATVGADRANFIDAGGIAERLFGDSVFANMILLGNVFQSGWIPLQRQSIEQALRLNGIAVELNLAAFAVGRCLADGRPIPGLTSTASTVPQNQEDVVASRRAYLEAYQDRAYAARYGRLVEATRQADSRLNGAAGALTDAVADSFFTLMAYKDEYEVARLFAAPDFKAALDRQFTGTYKLHFHMAPPLLPLRGTADGWGQKRRYGPWMLTAMGGLRHLKRLRGTPFDPFGWSAERRRERRLVDDYERIMGRLLSALDPATYDTVLAFAGSAKSIRGFGHVKAAAMDVAERRQAEILAGVPSLTDGIDSRS